MLGRTAEGQTPPPFSLPPTGTEAIARELDIELEIVGDTHPDLPSTKDGSRHHGALYLEWKEGRWSRVLLSNNSVPTMLAVFHRRWKDEQPFEARAVACSMDRTRIREPGPCFRAILQKMEGGRGPVMLQVRYFVAGGLVGSVMANTVQ